VSRRRERERGQALVEFSIGILVFLALFIATIDLARGVFMYNGVSQAARELARETSVYPGTGTLGSSTETQAVLSTQRNLVPGLQTPTFECVDLSGVPQFDTCRPGDWVKVTTTTRFVPSLPFLTSLMTLDLTSSSSAEIQ
jgi:Flp pilus assembly protein TadG